MHGDLFPLSLEHHKGQASTGMIGEKAGTFKATHLIEIKVRNAEQQSISHNYHVPSFQND